jgi:hypothetical protein
MVEQAFKQACRIAREIARPAPVLIVIPCHAIDVNRPEQQNQAKCVRNEALRHTSVPKTSTSHVYARFDGTGE